MNLIEAIVLGVVEGITEYLPVSSTGHLILTSWLLGLDKPPEVHKAVKAFEIIIQGGAILAVIGLFRARVASMVRGLIGKDRGGLRLFTLLVVSCIPAAVLGLLLKHAIDEHLFKPVPVLIALFCGGVLLILIKRWQDALLARHAAEGAATFKSIEDLTIRDALLIGFMQCLGMWPGTSRSMVTIIGGMLVGLPPARAAEFSFLVGLPTLLGACLVALRGELKEHGSHFIDLLGGWGPVLLGIAVATISAAIAVRWLVGYLGKHSLAIFGWWRIAVALVMAALIWSGQLTIEPEPKSQPTAAEPGVPNPPAH